MSPLVAPAQQDHKNLTVLETILNDPSYRLIRADSADQALLALVAEEFALLVLDISMPGMSGLELLPRAKSIRPDVPIIMITAYGDAETKRRALENGAEALLTKPIDFGMLRSEIELRVGRIA